MIAPWHRVHRLRSACRARRGFTLIELLVVLVVLAISAAAAVPAFLTGQAGGPEREAATALAVALTRVRDGARASGAPGTLVLAPSEGRMWLAWRDSTIVERLPLAAGITFAAQHAGQTERAECRFTPTGTATPFVVTVQGRHNLAVRVDGWSGEITIGDGAPR
jgi:prepilin-type N-terminal cleavage/methylation domain-containing protein